MRIINETRGCSLAEQAVVADSFWSRLRGLLGKGSLAPGEGLILKPCNWVHSIGMAFPIDVLYVSPHGQVLAAHTLRPNRWGPLIRGSHLVVELPEGTLAKTKTVPGDRLLFEPA
ncbi:MAG: DUF192 domain-containing protein [Limnochordia bacterium]